MPPKKKAQSATSKTSKESCCVCCQPITIGKDESLFCSGSCQHWLYCYCAGVSSQCYTIISEKAAPFLCFACSQASHTAEVQALKETIDLLKGEIAALKSLSSARTDATIPAATTTTQAAVSSHNQLVSRAALPRSGSQRQNGGNNNDRKYNVVVYGITECPKGTPRLNRFEEDLNKAMSAFSYLDLSIDPKSIKDIYHLGKFSTENKKPRPLLVKFIHVSDASAVLSSKGPQGQKHHFVIKPDMLPNERRSESLLLKERWGLIQSGTPRENIKICGSSLYLRNKLHGQIVKSGSSISFQNHNSEACNVDDDVHSVPTVPPQQSTTILQPSPSAADMIQQDLDVDTPTHVQHTLNHHCPPH